MNQDLLALTHTADEYDKYLNAVVPPVFMNSLHVYDRFEDYCNVDVYKDDQFVYGRSSWSERSQNWSTEAVQLLFHQEWQRVQQLSWQPARQEATLFV